MFRVCAGVIIHTQMLRLVFIALQSEVRTKSKALISLRKWEATIRLTHNREKGEMAETIKSSIVAANAAVKLVSELRQLIPTFQLYSHAGQLRNHMCMCPGSQSTRNTILNKHSMLEHDPRNQILTQALVSFWSLKSYWRCLCARHEGPEGEGHPSSLYSASLAVSVVQRRLVPLVVCCRPMPSLSGMSRSILEPDPLPIRFRTKTKN